MKIDSVKIFGERHTGTNSLNLFLRENCELEFKYYEFLGWKHRLAPKKVEWMKHDTNNVLFIFLFRNPYTWLNSMYKEPYYHHYLKINDRSFEEFIKFSIEDYENSICLWNLKNNSYLRMSKDSPKTTFIQPWNNELDQSVLYTPPVETGDILITPQFVTHYTEPNKTNFKKRIISFDFHLEPILY